MNITVTKNQVSINTDYILNDKEYNVNKCYFTFSDEYTDDLVKKAIFVQGTSTIEMSIINNQCQIPAEVLNNGQFELRVYAYEVDGEELLLRYSPSYTTAYVRTGSYIENAESPEVITPTQFEQYMQAMNDGLNEVANVDIDAEQLDNGMSVTITNRYGENKTVYAYDGEKGETGATGATGNGIASFEKTSTSGLVDIYTITFTNGTTSILTVTNGKGITSIIKTSASNLTDTYTITYNDNTTSTFYVNNGRGIVSIDLTYTEENIDTYTITYNDGTTSTYTVTNSTVTDQEFETLETEVNKYKTLSLLLPKVTGEGSSIELNDTVEGVTIDITPEGNTSQITYSGKNLFNKDGEFRQGFLGDAGEVVYSAQSVTLIDYIPVEQNKSYICSYDVIVEGSQFRGVAYYDANKTFISRSTPIGSFTTPANTAFIRIYFYNPNDMSVEQLPNYIQNIQLEQGSSATNYEPYVGGTASPNPNYPQNIKVVKGDNTIKINGKNLFDKDNTNLQLNGIYITSSKVLGSTQTKSIFIQCKSNTTYTVSKIISSRFAVGTTNTLPVINTNIIDFVQNNNSSSITITTSSNANYLVVFYYHSNYDTLTEQKILNTIQIEENNQATSYEPFKNNIYNIDLGNIELCKIGNYKDYIYKENNTWYKYKVIEKVVLNGTQTINQINTNQTNTTRVMYKNIAPNSINNSINVYCNRLIGKINWSTDEEGIYTNSDSIVFRINKTTIGTTENEINTYLTTNNIILYYVLATPTTTEITDTTLINQLNNLYSAVANQDKTFIECTSTELNNAFLIVKASTYKDISSILNPVMEREE